MTTIGSSLGRCHLLAPLALTTIAAGPPDERRILYVHDDDTFRLESGECIRVAGIDAPETDPRQAKCSDEVALGNAARERARALIDRRDVSSCASAAAISARSRA